MYFVLIFVINPKLTFFALGNMASAPQLWFEGVSQLCKRLTHTAKDHCPYFSRYTTQRPEQETHVIPFSSLLCSPTRDVVGISSDLQPLFVCPLAFSLSLNKGVKSVTSKQSHIYSLKLNALKYSSKSYALPISRRFDRNHTAQLWYLIKRTDCGLSDCQTERGYSPVPSQATFWRRYNSIHPYFTCKRSSNIQLLQQSTKPQPTKELTVRSCHGLAQDFCNLCKVHQKFFAENKKTHPTWIYNSHVSYCYGKPSPFLHGGLVQF